MDAIKRYRMRRASRLADRGYRADADDGQWVTTEKGNHIHINENGEPDKGNPYVLAAAKGKSTSKKTAAQSKSKEKSERKYITEDELWDSAISGKKILFSTETGDELFFDGDKLRRATTDEVIADDPDRAFEYLNKNRAYIDDDYKDNSAVQTKKGSNDKGKRVPPADKPPQSHIEYANKMMKEYKHLFDKESFSIPYDFHLGVGDVPDGNEFVKALNYLAGYDKYEHYTPINPAMSSLVGTKVGDDIIRRKK